MEVKKKKVLIVDDDKEFLDELKELLLLSGYEAVTISESSAALDAMVAVEPDVVVLDIKMPGMNGFQVAQQIKQRAQHAHIPIVAISGYFKEEGHSEAIKGCGIVACLNKPFNPLDIIATIEKVLIEDKKSGYR
jgi:CheY-like chemotaxis protein